jgi:hypothetical protein
MVKNRNQQSLTEPTNDLTSFCPLITNYKKTIVSLASLFFVILLFPTILLAIMTLGASFVTPIVIGILTVFYMIIIYVMYVIFVSYIQPIIDASDNNPQVKALIGQCYPPAQ